MHSDLEEGEAAMRLYPAFMHVTTVISPAEQSRKLLGYKDVDCEPCKERREQNKESPSKDCVYCKGSGKTQRAIYSEPTIPLKAKWTEMGACLCPALKDPEGNGTVRWGGDGKDCPEWRPRLVQIRNSAA